MNVRQTVISIKVYYVKLTHNNNGSLLRSQHVQRLFSLTERRHVSAVLAMTPRPSICLPPQASILYRNG